MTAQLLFIYAVSLGMPRKSPLQIMGKPPVWYRTEKPYGRIFMPKYKDSPGERAAKEASRKQIQERFGRLDMSDTLSETKLGF